jgi:hypothetical protein
MTKIEKIVQRLPGCGFRFHGALSGSMSTGWTVTVTEPAVGRSETFTGATITGILAQIKKSFGSIPNEVGVSFEWGDSHDPR